MPRTQEGPRCLGLFPAWVTHFGLRRERLTSLESNWKIGLKHSRPSARLRDESHVISCSCCVKCWELQKHCVLHRA